MAEEIIGIKITTDAAQATEQVKKLDTAFDSTDQSVKSLRTQMREAAADVQVLSDKFGATSKEAIEAAKKAADLKDRIGDAKALTDAFNPDAKFKAVASSLAGVAGGFAALQGGMALFGKENKNVEAALLKVNAAMALSQGLQSVGESVDSFKQLGAVIKSSTAFQTLNNAATSTATTIQKAFGIATVQTSVGFNVLKGAIIATGIGALVVALGLVIQNFDKISKWIMSSPLGDLARGVGNLVEQFTDFIGVTSEAERNLDKLSAANKRANEDIENRIKILKAQGGSEKEIYELSKQRLENELNDIRNASKVKNELSTEDQKKIRDLKVEQLVLTAEFNKKSAEEDKKAAEEAKKKRDEANKQVIADKTTADKMLLELQKANSLSVIEDENEKAIKVLDIDRKAKEDEIKQLKVQQSIKDELIRLNNQKFEADKLAIEKKAEEEARAKEKERVNKELKFEEELQSKLSETRISKIKEGKDKEIVTLDEKLLEETKKILNNADYTENQKGLLIAALRNKYGVEIAAIDGKFLKEANDKEFDKFNTIANNEKLTFDARKKGVDDAGVLNKKLYADGKISGEEFNKTEAQLSEARIKIGKAESESRAENAQKISSTLKNVAKAVGEHTVAGKAAAIVSTTIDTFMSATAAFASLAKIPVVGVPLGIAAAAMAVAAGMKNVKSILAVKTPPVPGGSSDPGFVNIPSPAGGVGSMGSMGSMPSLDNITMPDLGSPGGGDGGSVRASGDTIVRAYVVESDITDSQSRMQEIENRARFE